VQKYASNPVIDFLRTEPYEHRVAVLPFPVPDQLALFGQVYNIEWLQQLFPYNNIQSLDEIMNPRPHEDEIAFRTALFFDRSTNTVHRITRNWELTNTRYLLGPAAFLDVLNESLIRSSAASGLPPPLRSRGSPAYLIQPPWRS
jgi:hypothetical protein